jgi:hypothetical protein
VYLPILLELDSVNQTLPFLSAATANGPELGVGTANSEMYEGLRDELGSALAKPKALDCARRSRRKVRVTVKNILPSVRVLFKRWPS